MPKKGIFIVFEGLDGSGQSTQVKFLTEYLKRKGRKVLATKEPTLRSVAGRKIRRVLDKKIKLGARELQELFAKDRAWHVKKVIILALAQGKIVISDRYFFSSFAFGAASSLSLRKLQKMNKKFLFSDLTFILDVRPETSLARIEKRGKPKTLFERADRLAKVRKIYRTFPKRFQNVYLINGEKPIKKVFENIKKVVHSKLNI